MIVGPDANDDAAVLKLPGEETYVVAKMESHCSPPCVPPRPYDSSATGVGGSARDVVAMGQDRSSFLIYRHQTAR